MSRGPLRCVPSAVLTAATLAGCSSSVPKAVADLCRREARAIVTDRARWRAYLERATEADRRELRRHGDGAIGSTLDPREQRSNARRNAGMVRPIQLLQQLPPAFAYRFVKERTDANEPIGAVVRNDVEILFEGRSIARLVNYNGSYRGLGSSMSIACVDRPELYVGASADR